MNRSYFAGFIPLFLFTSTPGHAADWEKAHHEVTTFLGVLNNNNLFNTAAARQTDQRVDAGLRWDWLGLFEGYGVQVPLQIERHSYRATDDLDASLYQLQPEVRFFLSAQTDLAFKATVQKQQVLAGDAAAEFLSVAEQALTAQQRGAEATLSFGRAPDVQNLQLTLGTDRRQQDVRAQRLSQLDGDFVKALYSHKLNENVALVADLLRRQEQQNGLSTDLNQYGAGIAVQWTGQQFFRLTAGRFSRSYAGGVQAENAGTFWQLHNLWQFDARWLLEISSGRSSVLSYASKSVSQLDTEHQASLHWQYDQSHRFSLFASRLTSTLDQTTYRRNRQALGSSWQWQWSRQWQSLVRLSQVQQTQQQQPDRNRLELAGEVRWSW